MFANETVESLALGHSFQAAAMQTYLLQNFRGTRHRDAVRLDLDPGEVWLFDYGVAVFWGCAEDAKQSLLKRLAEFVVEPSARRDFEHYSFAQDAEQNQMHHDHIALAGSDPLDRLAVSHALAQSAKLSTFESLAEQVIANNAHVSKSLARSGRIPFGRRRLARLRGELFGARSDILLHFGLLDTPEFFWDYPEREPLYLIVSRYLDIVARITVLDKKLLMIHELLDMLASERNHQHSSILEWIIIILIAVEIVLFFDH